jgi:hypothetical protein
MEKVIIANWGSAAQGKSNTVKRVAKEILAHYKNATFCVWCRSIPQGAMHYSSHVIIFIVKLNKRLI